MAAKSRNKLSNERDLFSALDPEPVQVHTDVAPLPDPNLRLAEVAVDGPVRGTFTYSLDDGAPQLQPGARVLVPFGRRNLIGFYIGPRSSGDLAKDGIDPAKLKPITKILDGGDGRALMTPNLLTLAHWIARHYACPLGAT